MPLIKTMTLDELNDRMHEYGMKTSKDRLADGITRGAYPFAVCLRESEGRRLLEIYTKKFEEWVKTVAYED